MKRAEVWINMYKHRKHKWLGIMHYDSEQEAKTNSGGNVVETLHFRQVIKRKKASKR
jgi:hypothetical protein